MPTLINNFPALPIWAQQLAGILPLCALVEFIDVASKLHLYELSASVPLWNWPVTPAGARLLLSAEDTTDACCLDRAERSVILDCFDGRKGDRYPCSTPATTRLWVSAQQVDATVVNGCKFTNDSRARRQKLDVFLISQTQSVSLDQAKAKNTWSRIARTRPTRYQLVSGAGWLGWIGITFVRLAGGLYIASGYLILMPITGIIVRLMHGGKPRQLLDTSTSGISRAIIAASNLNGSEWWMFYGGRHVVNSLLNKPLYRAGSSAFPLALTRLLKLLIVGQWALALASRALQDWNAFLISIWIVFCAWTSSQAYPPAVSVQDWLRYTCKINVRPIQTEFFSRRAMLSAIVYLNPDTKYDPDAEHRCTDWMDSILSKGSPDRRKCESELLAYLKNSKTCDDDTVKNNYWWQFIEEAIPIGEKIEKTLQSQMPEMV